MKVISQKDTKIDSLLAEEISRRSGENVFLCYQCKKCASGCPNRKFMDGTPTELMRYVQLGMIDEAMKKNTVWLCLSCQTCTSRCPQGIDIACVVDALKIIAQQRKIKADSNNVKLFNWLWMKMLKYTGRIHEASLAGLLNLLGGKPFKDLPLAIKMIKKGKLKMLPSIKKPILMIRMFARARKFKK